MSCDDNKSKPIFFRLYERITEDQQVTVWHMSLYAFLLLLWQKSDYSPELKVSRRQLMSGAHFGSITTYHKCISELKELGYIQYFPSYDVYQCSIIKLIL